MKAPRPMIPGGETARIAANGGEDLYQKLQLQLAGNPIERVAYALPRCLASLVLLVGKPTLEEAEAFVDIMAEDIKNEVRLNWGGPEHSEAVAEMKRMNSDPATWRSQ